MKRLLVSILTILLYNFSFGQNGTEPIKVTDMLKIKSIGGVSLSKDAKNAVFTVTVIEPEGDSKNEYRYMNQIWMVNTEWSNDPYQGVPKQLTGKESSSQPAFSPDGRQIAFVRLADGKPQI